jgi:hypothetical protein
MLSRNSVIEEIPMSRGPGRPPIGERAMTEAERKRRLRALARERAGMAAKPAAAKPAEPATKPAEPDRRDAEIARLKARIAELEGAGRLRAAAENPKQ